jgi:hypothetical protein
VSGPATRSRPRGRAVTRCAVVSRIGPRPEAGLRSWPRLLRPAGEVMALPAGCRLADEHRPGRYCFLLLDGSAVAQAGGCVIATFSAGSFVGSLDDQGRPSPLAGITVRLTTPASAVVLDARRLAMLLESDRVLAGAWLRHKPIMAKRDQLSLPAMSRAAM